MTSLVLDSKKVGWKEGAEAGVATGTGAGILWAIFRFLVGSIVAAQVKGLSNDMAVLQNDIKSLRESNHDLAERLNTVFEKLIETRQ